MKILLLLGSHSLSQISQREYPVFQAEHPEKEIIRSWESVMRTQPVRTGDHEAMRRRWRYALAFHGYAPEQRAALLRNIIAKEDFQGERLYYLKDEIFISDGKVRLRKYPGIILLRQRYQAVCDPVYPVVYVDSNVMAGRSGLYNGETGHDKIDICRVLLTTDFFPEFP